MSYSEQGQSYTYFAHYWVEIYNPDGKKVDGDMFFFKKSGQRWAQGKIKSISQARKIKPEVFEVEV